MAESLREVLAAGYDVEIRRVRPGDELRPHEQVDVDDSHHGFYGNLAWRKVWPYRGHRTMAEVMRDEEKSGESHVEQSGTSHH